MRGIAATDAYRHGDLDADAAYYRAHFSMAITARDHLERLVARLRVHFTPETVLVAREIERRLYEETWLRPEYDLLPRLRHLDVPTLVVHGDRDFVPIEVARHIASAVPHARLVMLPDCGHFAYLERPDEVREQASAFLAPT
jgi:pimeloyl-ACP methyl ester carboxylesterase